MNKLLSLLVLSFFWSYIANSKESVDFICKGISSTTKSVSSVNNTTMEVTGTNYKSNSYTKIYLSFFEKEKESRGWIQLPNHILPKIKKKKKGNRYDLYNIDLDEDQEFMTAKFKLNFMNKPELSWDLKTGMMEFKGFGLAFSGDCRLKN